jgi:hypothetical protein
LKRLACQIRRPLYRESLALCTGKVVKKYVEGNEHLIDLSGWPFSKRDLSLGDGFQYSERGAVEVAENQDES